MSQFPELEERALSQIAAAPSTDALKQVELAFLGKNGEVMALMKQLGSLPADQRPAFGQSVNALRQAVQGAVDERFATLKADERKEQFEREKIDITLSSRRPKTGREHILQLTTNRVMDVMTGMGFEYRESPELEHFKYNFDALNYPPDHPAMDDQDTFYIDDNWLLRTQCTALQGHVFEELKPPFRIFTVGRTFRNEAVDRTHGHTFHQIDVFMVDEGVSMANLKWTLKTFAQALIGDDVKVRFRPDFFPFVEPGVDYAVSSQKLFNGRWVELGGAGLIHPNILERYGIDTKKYSGFAFGLGLERIPMMAHGVDDLRHFLENDLRFLHQFR